MNFKTKKERLDAEGILKQGTMTEFWKLIVRALQESKEALQKLQDGEDIANLPAEQYKLMNELYKAKKEYLDTLTRTPENIISWLQDPISENKDFDPYAKEKD